MPILTSSLCCTRVNQLPTSEDGDGVVVIRQAARRAKNLLLSSKMNLGYLWYEFTETFMIQLVKAWIE